MIGGNRVCNVLQHHGFTRFRWGHQQTTLAFTNGCHQVDDTASVVFFAAHVAFQLQRLVRVQRCQVFKQNFVFAGFRRFAVHLVYFHQRKVTFTVFGGAYFTFDAVTRVQVKAANLAGRNVNVVRAGQVRGFW